MSNKNKTMLVLTCVISGKHSSQVFEKESVCEKSFFSRNMKAAETIGL